VVASWLVRSPPDRVVQVQALAMDIVLCSLARNSHSIFGYWRMVPANLMLGLTLQWICIPPGGNEFHIHIYIT